MKKRKMSSDGFYLLPCIVLFVLSYMFEFMLQMQEYYTAFSQLGAVCRYLAFFYSFAAFFNYLNNRSIRKRTGSVKEKKVKLFFKHRAKPRKTETEAELATQSEAVPDEQLRTDKAIVTSSKSIAVFYVIIQLLLLAKLAISSFDFTYKITSNNNNTYSLFHCGLLIVLAVASLSLKKWSDSRENVKGIKLASSIYTLLGIDFIIYAALIAVTVVLRINAAIALTWIFIALSLYIAINFGICIVLSIIKKEVLSNFSYTLILPRVIRGKSKDSDTENLLDTLKKNTGISLKSLWSIRYTASILPGAVLGIAAVVFISTCIYKVEPYQQAIVYRFGAISESSIVGKGLHLKLPWPIEKEEIYNVDRVKEVTVGYTETDAEDNLWTQTHTGEEHKLLMGNGNELVSVNIKLAYTIDDLYSYVMKSADPSAFAVAKAYEIIMHRTISTTVDTFLSVDRSDLSSQMKTELNKYCDDENLGIEIVEVIVESIHPPIEISDIYQNVVSAGIKKTTAVINAEKAAQSTIIAAEKDSESKIIDAKASQTARISSASYEMSVYNAAFEAHKINPKAFEFNKYITTYEKIINGHKVYVFSPNAESEIPKMIVNSSGSKNVIVAE